MALYLISVYPSLEYKIEQFPVVVGREASEWEESIVFDAPTVSRRQFRIFSSFFSLYYENLSGECPATVNGKIPEGKMKIETGAAYTVELQEITLVISSNRDLAIKRAGKIASSRYVVDTGAKQYGPMDVDTLLGYCEDGTFGPASQAFCPSRPGRIFPLSEIVDFTEDESSGSVPNPSLLPVQAKIQDPGASAVDGESISCPFCMTVSDISDLLAVSVSPLLMGDAVLGSAEQKRFLPTQFTPNGLAIDPEGGICTEIACPKCHLAMPNGILERNQIVMSVIGAAGAGKSVFLASSIWKCRQMLDFFFNIGFTDLDPVANRWINDYEEKLFFQEDDRNLQQIAKTDLNASNVSRVVNIDGESVLLPLPGFFRIRPPGDANEECLVLYDSAGEHFRAGGDTHANNVTLNMLNADLLFFMFDPSADPRFRRYIDAGCGSAANYAQRQDVLLSEILARNSRHKSGGITHGKLDKPFIFGLAKADLLREHLPLEREIYCPAPGGGYALDMGALAEISEKTKDFLQGVVPEVVSVACGIAKEVWFVPISSLGHNPMKEGIRPCDINSVFAEFPIVFTLMRKGYVPQANLPGRLDAGSAQRSR